MMVTIPYCPDHLKESYEKKLYGVYELFEKETRQDIDLIINYTRKNAEVWFHASQESRKYSIFLNSIRALGTPSELLKKERHDAAIIIQKHLRGWYFRKTCLWNPNCSIGRWDLSRKTRALI